MRNTYRTILMVGIAVTTVGTTGVRVQAQENASSGQTVDTGTSENGLGAEETGEIIVTARKRSESAQSVPVSIQVLGSEGLSTAGATSIQNLSSVAPGLNIQGAPEPASFAVTIRGLGSQPGNPSLDSSVSLFVDGVYSPRPREFDASIFDVQRIEVIKGTQTALLGKNTSLGAVSLVTKKPGSYFGYEVKLQTELEYGSGHIEAGMDLPITDTFQVRLSGLYGDEQGPMRNLVTGQGGPNQIRKGGRIVGLWKPADAVQVTAMYQHAETSVDGPSAEVVATTAAGFALAAAGGQGALFEPNFDYRTTTDATLVPGGSFTNVRSDRGSLTVEWDLNGHTVTSQTGYTSSESDAGLDGDAIAGDFFTRITDDSSRQWTQELRIASPADGVFTYLAGVLFLDSKFKSISIQDVDYPFGPAPGAPNITGTSTTYFDQKDRAYSAFGQVSYRLTDALGIDLGARYTHEKKSVDLARITNRSGLYSIAVTPPYAPFKLSSAEDSFDGSIGINYKIASDILLYASWGQGTKAGGYAQSASLLDQSRIDAEVAQTAEIGFKTQFRDPHLTLNGAFFHTDVKDYQLVTFNGTNFIVGNTDLKSTGFEGEISWQPFDGARLFWNNVYAKSIDKLSGNDIPFAPRWSGTVGASYAIMVLSDKDLSFTADYVYRSSQTSQQNLNGIPRLEASQRVNASIGLGDPSNGWEMRVIGRNITNEKIIGFNYAAPLLPLGNIIGMPLMPRTVLLQLTLRR